MSLSVESSTEVCVPKEFSPRRSTDTNWLSHLVTAASVGFVVLSLKLAFSTQQKVAYFFQMDS